MKFNNDGSNRPCTLSYGVFILFEWLLFPRFSYRWKCERIFSIECDWYQIGRWIFVSLSPVEKLTAVYRCNWLGNGSPFSGRLRLVVYYFGNVSSFGFISFYYCDSWTLLKKFIAMFLCVYHSGLNILNHFFCVCVTPFKNRPVQLLQIFLSYCFLFSSLSGRSLPICQT